MSEMFTTECERKIFAGVFKKDEDVTMRRNLLRSTMGVMNAYKNEYQVFYRMLSDKPTLTFDKEYLKLYLTIHKGLFTKNSNIDMQQFSMGDQDAYTAFMDSCINLFDECHREEIDNDSFELALEKFKMQYVSQQSLGILEDCAEIVSDGKTVRGKQKQGYEDMRRYMTDNFTALDKVTTGSTRKGAIVYGVNDEDDDKRTERKLIGHWGIPSLDKTVGIMEGTMISVLAPPKNGKSRLCYSLVEELISQGVNCLVWSKENTPKGAEYIIRAKNFNRNFNMNVSPEDKKFLDDGSLAQGKFDKPEYQELEDANWFSFRHREDYGRLISIDEDLCIENFIEIIDEQVTRYNIKVICVDYLQILSSQENSNISHFEIVSQGYRKMLQYIKNKNIAGFFPAQIKQDAIDVLNKSKDLGALDLRNVGGESSEVIRTPDINILLYASPVGLKMGQMTMIPLPSRCMPLIDPIDLQIDLGCAMFAEVQKNS